ncbi:(Fe-S)-binding protein [Cohnella thermotolerans]|uniref:(Fe-S)-binding protein n=1 Tax=Cohnella thermotolerans TaxID=329858 RepID=UPI0004097C38|nr:(Fe-S)-binding protein [Cohnella thermotolerans]
MANPQLASQLKIRLDEDQLTNCMRCGFCLPACPTFRETGVEAESPRGRIALMKAVADGLMEPDEAFEEQMNHCLGCRACEPACPADVKYGRLLEQARDAIEDHTRRHRLWVKGVRRLVFKELFPKQSRMRLAGKALHAYRVFGLQRLARRTGALKLLPRQLADMERILPAGSGRGVVERIGERHPAKGEKIATVGLFRGCLMDTLFTETNVHTVELLTEAGFEVVIPKTQNCCGALHAHSGEAEGARDLARRNIRAFKEAGVDFIVSNAGGCGAILVEYDHLLHEDSDDREDAAWFAERVKDVSELIVRYGRVPSFGPPESESGEERAASGSERTGAADAPLRITYQDSCHLRNVMRSSEAPRTLMRRVEGVEFVEMFEADRCCGSAGIYNLTQPEMANRILEHKMEHANATQAHYLLTSNPGCLLQMKLGVERHAAGSGMRVLHIVDFLHERMKRDYQSTV